MTSFAPCLPNPFDETIEMSEDTNNEAPKVIKNFREYLSKKGSGEKQLTPPLFPEVKKHVERVLAPDLATPPEKPVSEVEKFLAQTQAGMAARAAENTNWDEAPAAAPPPAEEKKPIVTAEIDGVVTQGLEVEIPSLELHFQHDSVPFKEHELIAVFDVTICHHKNLTYTCFRLLNDSRLFPVQAVVRGANNRAVVVSKTESRLEKLTKSTEKLVYHSLKKMLVEAQKYHGHHAAYLLTRIQSPADEAAGFVAYSIEEITFEPIQRNR